jgi:hypothetical protein
VHIIAFVAGATAVVATLWDAFETLVLPRTPLRTFRLTRLFYRATWSVWAWCGRRLRSIHRRERYLALFAPLSLFLLLTVWASALVVGFAALQWSQRALLLHVDGTARFSDDLYMSATTLFALGLADVTPVERAGRLLVVAETGSSLILLSMLFAYFPIVYQSFARRELSVTKLDAWGGAPPTATEILCRLGRAGELWRLEAFFAEWEQWCAELLESHLSYPAIAYFRSRHHRQSWVAALTAILDVSALVKVGVDGLPPWRAHLTFAIARHATVDLAHVLGPLTAADDERLPTNELAVVRDELERAGLHPNRSGVADEELAELRRSYEPYIAALSRRLMMPYPRWRPASHQPDNWQTSPADDGGPHF